MALPPTQKVAYRSDEDARGARLRELEREIGDLRGEISIGRRAKARRLALVALPVVVAAGLGALWVRGRTTECALQGIESSQGWTIVAELGREGVCERVSMDRAGVKTAIPCTMASPTQAMFAVSQEEASRGPFTVDIAYTVGSHTRRAHGRFDPAASAIEGVKHILSMTPAWVQATNTFRGPLLSFSGILAWRHGMTEIRYGFDDALDHTFPFSPATAISGLGHDDPSWIPLPPGHHSVTVEIAFKDGTTMRRTTPL